MSESKTLSGICEFVVDCEHKTAPIQETGYPSIRTPNIGRSRLLLEGVNRVSEEIYQGWTKRAVPQEGDLILAREAPVGNVAIITAGLKVCLGQRTVLIRPDKSKVFPHYLVYRLLGDEIQGVFHSFSGGATVPHLNMKDIRNLDLSCLPPLPTQRKIAAILSAYDDLMENNLRRIKILEEMAQNLYREWFVKFRFPGHQHARFIDSPLGRIPEGWEVVAFSALADYVNGYAFKPDDWGKQGRPIIKIRELKAGITAQTPRNTGHGIPEKYDICDGDVLFSWSADLDAYLWRGGSGLLNQHLFKVLPFAGFTRVFCFHALKEAMPRFRSLSLGATMHHIKRSALDQVLSTVPTAELRKRFDTLVGQMHMQLITLTTQVGNLRRTRDLLLPRLISGEVDVSDLDIAVPEETVA